MITKKKAPFRKRFVRNKKVMNATPTTVGEVNYKSKQEVGVAQMLKDAGIEAVYEGEKFELIPKFQYQRQKYTRPITLTPDFIGEDFIMEVKGFPNELFPVKWRLLHLRMMEGTIPYKEIYLVRNKKETHMAIELILAKRRNNEANGSV